MGKATKNTKKEVKVETTEPKNKLNPLGFNNDDFVYGSDAVITPAKDESSDTVNDLYMEHLPISKDDYHKLKQYDRDFVKSVLYAASDVAKDNATMDCTASDVIVGMGEDELRFTYNLREEYIDKDDMMEMYGTTTPIIDTNYGDLQKVNKYIEDNAMERWLELKKRK